LRVQRIVDQLSNDRGRPLDHLARGDLADELLCQLRNGASNKWRVDRRRGRIHFYILGQIKRTFEING